MAGRTAELAPIAARAESTAARRRGAGTLALILLAMVVAGLLLFPVIWLFVTSFKPNSETFLVPPVFLPQAPTLEVYDRVLNGRTAKPAPWALNFFNSMKIAVIAGLLATAVSSLAGYGLARYRFRGKLPFLLLILVAQMLPGPALLVPTAVLFSRVGWQNNHIGLILLYAAFAVPFTTWLAVGNFHNQPVELEEAAMVDGCSPFGAFVRVVLPLSRIGLITTFIFAFLMSWSEFPFALVLLQTDDALTVPVAMARLITEFNVFFNELGAATMLFTIPIFILFFLAQRYFIRGITAGALKQ